ncbi:MAG: hypothetical protein ACFCVD_03520 [Nodosilinea sp.]
MFQPALIALALAASPLPWSAPTRLAQASPSLETTLALCQTPNHAMRIYTLDGVTKLRAYDRAQKRVWLNTPALSQPNPEGYDYVNERGEVAVKVFVPNSITGQCFITIGDQPPEAGEIIEREPSSGD